MIKAVLFDLDNTLIDFMKMKKRCSEAAIAAMVDAGLNMSERKAMEKLFELYERYGMEDQQIFDKFLLEETGQIDYKILASGIAAYRRVKFSHLTPFPHTHYALIKLKEMGLKLGIVSDAPKKQAWLRLAELQLIDFFDVVVALEDTGKTKPHTAPFKKAVAQLSLSPEEILFVGDNPLRDITGAKRVGMKTALALYGQVVKAKTVEAHFKIKDIRELPELVKKINKQEPK
jgi:putative hydrolase of the HAD superfamily